MGFSYRGIGEGGFRAGSVQSGAPPILNFDFTTGALPGAIAFTRPSIGTYINNAGTLITAGNNVARMNYVGGVSNLLIEPAATNLLLQSNAFSTAPWGPGVNSVATPAQFVSPDGSNNGWTITSGSGGFDGYYQLLTFANATYTASAWVKQAASVPVDFQIKAIDSSVPTSPALQRLSATTAVTAGSSALDIIVLTATASVVMGVYGAQLETGSNVTSYIPTTTAAVTRAADSAVLTIPAGIGHLTFTFDDNTTQLVTVSAGSYTVPTNLNRPNIKRIVGSA
jgi:hypothetical protein